MASPAQHSTETHDLMARRLHLLGLWLIEQGKLRPVGCADDYSEIALEYVMAEHGLCKYKARRNCNT